MLVIAKPYLPACKYPGVCITAPLIVPPEIYGEVIEIEALIVPPVMAPASIFAMVNPLTWTCVQEVPPLHIYCAITICALLYENQVSPANPEVTPEVTPPTGIDEGNVED